MELFSEIYSCYYQVLRHLLACQSPLTMEEIRSWICEEGFEESLLSIIPKLESGSWNLFEKDGEVYLSKINAGFLTPLSRLQKAYLKALLSDPRMGLFLSGEQLESLGNLLDSVEPLWKQGQICYYDRFADGDPYGDEGYRSNFRTLLMAQKRNQYVDLDYTAPSGARVHHYYVPARLEYSVKNDKFRLLALKQVKNSRIRLENPKQVKNGKMRLENSKQVRDGRMRLENSKQANDGRMRLETLNIARIQSVRPVDKFLTSQINLNALIEDSYYKEPLRLHIINRRNALERAMLHFANYKKNTRKIDENTYECLIYYNQSMETELLIEVLSFGPMIRVIGNDRFLASLKRRLQKQIECHFIE